MFKKLYSIKSKLKNKEKGQIGAVEIIILFIFFFLCMALIIQLTGIISGMQYACVRSRNRALQTVHDHDPKKDWTLDALINPTQIFTEGKFKGYIVRVPVMRAFQGVFGSTYIRVNEKIPGKIYGVWEVWTAKVPEDEE
ncbi:MAG: hypothetical protein AB1410_04825 [Acidobacteriota bacterium]